MRNAKLLKFQALAENFTKLHSTTVIVFDFNAQRGPCKHIYKLAAELGLLPPLPMFNAEKAETFKQSIPAEVDRFKQQYLAGAISADKFIKIVNALNSK